MGMFNSIDWSDPAQAQYFGALMGLGAAAAPTRTPTSWGAALGSMYGGAQQGAKDALAYQQQQQATQEGAMNLALDKAALAPYLARIQGNKGGAAPTGQPPSSASGTSSAAGPSVFDDFYQNFLAGHEGGYKANDGNGKPANFGINQAANPDVDVSKLTQDQAKQIIHDRYWKPSGADSLSPQLAAIQGDTAVNMGPKVAWQLLAQSQGDPQKYLALRAQRYQQIAQKDPTKAQYLDGWMKRNADLGQYVSGAPQAPAQGGPQAQGSTTAAPAGASADNGSGLPDNIAQAQIMKHFGMTPGAYQSAIYFANSLPPGPQRDEALAAAHHIAGYDLTVNSREGSEVLNYDPESTAPGGYEEVNRNPKLPEGFAPGRTKDTYTPLRPDTSQPQVNTQAPAGTPPVQGAATPQGAPATAPAPAAAPAAAPPSATGTQPITPSNTKTGTPLDYSVALPQTLGDFQKAVPGFKPPAPLMDAVQEGQQPLKGKTQEALVEHDEQRLEKYQEQAAGGPPIYNAIGQLYQIIKDGLSTGNATLAATNLANYAHQFGYDNLIPKGFNPTDANAFHKLATQLVFAQVSAMGGKVLVSEITGLSQANPNESLTPEANADILTNLLADQRWKDSRSAVAKEYMGQYGYLGNFDQQFNQRFPEINVTQGLLDAAKKAGWKLPGSNAAAPQGAPQVDQKIQSGLSGLTQKDWTRLALKAGTTVDALKQQYQQAGYKVK